jgi:hypothetical protein
MSRIDDRAHLTVRQLVVAVVAFVVVIAMVLVDRRSDDGDTDDLDLTGGVALVDHAGASGVAIPVIVDATEQDRLDIAAVTWFCPGVPGNDGTISGSLVLANPGGEDMAATVTHYGSGVEPTESAVSVPARSSVTVEATGGLQSPFVATIVEMFGVAGSVEQVITHPAGNATTTCSDRTASEWYFADGFTAADSIENIILSNPFSDASVVDVSYVTRESGREPQNLQGLVVPPRSVLTLQMGAQGARNEPVLAVAVRATSGRIVAARSQHYLGQGRLGYVMNLGAMGTSTDWWFADGEKGEGVAEQLVIFNPTGDDQSVSVVFLNGVDPAATIEPLVVAAPAGRVTVVDTTALPTLPPGRYGINISVIDDLTGPTPGVVVEQVINRRAGNQVGTSIVLGVPSGALSRVWSAPSGFTPGLPDSLVVLNATPNDTTVSIEQVGPAGAVPIVGFESVAVPAAGVVVIATPAGLPQGEFILRSGEPVVVQRMLTRGGDLVGRTTALGFPHLGGSAQ